VTTVQLRRYDIEPGRMTDYLAWFPSTFPVREKFGFRLLFAYADDAADTFTWAVEHDGDEAEFREVEAAYTASPERAAAFETYPKCVTNQQVGLVRSVL